MSEGRAFIGRIRERDELRAGLGDALSARARLFLIAGEAGIGKTALCEQIANEAGERGASVLWGRCWEGEGAPPYWPWTQAIRAWGRGASQQRWARHLEGAADLVVHLVPEIAGIVADHPPLATDHEEARFQLFDGVTTFFRSASRDRPLALFLEDVHWADRSSLLLLQFFAREIADAPILVVATHRDLPEPGRTFSDVLARLRHERIATRLPLRGLPETDVGDLLEALGGEPVSTELVRAVARETEGNPFFVEELFRHLVDEEVLVRDAGRRVSRLAAGEIPLPESLRDVIARRLERLTAPCRQTLRTASVLGREFSLAVLGEVTDRSYGDLLDALDPAQAVGLIREQPDAIGRFEFSHGLVREALYQDLRTLERVRLHREVGEALERAYASDPEPHLSELAHHFFEAGGAARAVDYALRAARRAREQFAWEEALALYGQALDGLDQGAIFDDRLRCTILLERGEVIQDASGRPQARGTFLQAARLAEQIDEPDFFARAALGVAGSFTDFEVYGNTVQVEILEKALDRLEPGDSPRRATVMGQLSAALTFAEAEEKKLSLAREAVAMARRVGDRHSLTHILFVTQAPLWRPDNLTERLEQARETLRLAKESGETRLSTLGWSMLVAQLLEAGEIEAVRREERVRRRAVHEAFGRAMVNVTEGMLALLEGRFGEVEPLAEQALDFVQSPDATAILSSYNAQMLFLRREQDRLDEIVDATRAFLDQYPSILSWRGSLAWALAELDRLDEARAELERLADGDFCGILREMLWMPTIWQLSEVAVTLGDLERCETLYRLLSPYADRCVTIGPAICAGSLSRPLGSLAAALGRHEEAERYFLRGLETDSRLGARPWVAWGRLGLARMLLARGGPEDSDRAGVLLREAGETARALGMKALERRLAGVAVPEPAVRAAKPGPARPAPDRSANEAASIHRDARQWTIRWGGRTLRLRHTKGLSYLAYLLARPGEEIHALDLLVACGERPSSGTSDVLERLRDLRNELEEANALQDLGRAERLSPAIEQLTEDAASERTGPEAERARLGVTKPVKTAIRKIREIDAALGRHLETSVRTGYVCTYSPEPGTPAWTTSR